MKYQPRLQSSEDRESYPLQGNYPEYSRDMFFLSRIAKSLVEIIPENYSKLSNSFINVYIDFEKGRYEIFDFVPDMLLQERIILIPVTLEEFFSHLSNPYDLYLNMKLYFDNVARTRQHLVHAQ